MKLPSPEVLARFDLEPKYVYKGNGADYKVSNFFTDGNGRVFVIADVTVNGETARQVFYRSNSSASFRNLPARNDFPGVVPGYDKGPGEEFLAASSDLQAFISGKLKTAPPVGELPKFDPRELEGIIPVNRNYEDYLKYTQDKDSIYKNQNLQER